MYLLYLQCAYLTQFQVGSFYSTDIVVFTAASALVAKQGKSFQNARIKETNSVKAEYLILDLAATALQSIQTTQLLYKFVWEKMMFSEELPLTYH